MPSTKISEVSTSSLMGRLEPKKRGPSPEAFPLLLLNAGQVAKLLGCSTRHVYRLSDGDKMPSPLRLGALVRWSRAAIEHWIAEGCPTRS